MWRCASMWCDMMRYDVCMSVSKRGTCGSCLEQDVEVRWHIGSRQWYCVSCWPRPKDVVTPARLPAGRSWEDGVPARSQMLEMRDGLFGIRVEDSESAVAHFRVRCPEHGWLADGLGIGQARRLCDDHRAAHMTAEVGLPQ